MKLKILNLLYYGQVPSIVNMCKMKLNLDEGIQRSIYLGTYEKEQSKWFKKYLKCGDVVVDIGANFGWYTTLSRSLVGTNGKIFAFEPSPVANNVIESMIKDNGFNNIILVKAAVGSNNSITKLFMPTIEYLHSPSEFMSGFDYIPLEVKAIKLDDYEPLKTIPKIKLVKIDVEGREPDVIAGMENLLKTGKVQYLIVEFNSYWLKMNKTAPQELHDKIINLGYTVVEETELLTNCKDLFGHNYSLQDKLFEKVV